MHKEELIKESVLLIQNSNYIVAFTGAGISTESGIPDFRSPGGLWEKYNPNEYGEYSAFLTQPEKFWTMYEEMSSIILKAEPNQAHKALAIFEQKLNLKTIITQNIDFLHNRAGNQRVLDIHGSGEYGTCLSCKQQYHYVETQKIIDLNGIPPRCTHCSGLIKPNVILFGEPLPQKIYSSAQDEIRKADLVIIIGSSLSVYPAALLPYIIRNTGAKVLIINAEPTPFDNSADIVIQGRAGEIFEKILHFMNLNLDY